MFEAKNPSYQGPERRGNSRRLGSDRRESIRFETDTADRRLAVGRREEDTTRDPWRIEF